MPITPRQVETLPHAAEAAGIDTFFEYAGRTQSDLDNLSDETFQRRIAAAEERATADFKRAFDAEVDPAGFDEVYSGSSTDNEHSGEAYTDSDEDPDTFTDFMRNSGEHKAIELKFKGGRLARAFSWLNRRGRKPAHSSGVSDDESQEYRGKHFSGHISDEIGYRGAHYAAREEEPEARKPVGSLSLRASVMAMNGLSRVHEYFRPTDEQGERHINKKRAILAGGAVLASAGVGLWLNQKGFSLGGRSGASDEAANHAPRPRSTTTVAEAAAEPVQPAAPEVPQPQVASLEHGDTVWELTENHAENLTGTQLNDTQIHQVADAILIDNNTTWAQAPNFQVGQQFDMMPEAEIRRILGL